MSWKVEPVEGPSGGILVSAVPVTVTFVSREYPIAAAVPATATLLYTQFIAGLFALLVIDTRLVPAPSFRNTSCDGGGGGGSATGGGPAAGGGAAGGAGSGGAAAGGAVGSGVQNPVAISEKLVDHGVLMGGAPLGEVPRSAGPDTVIPTPAINAAAAMTKPAPRLLDFRMSKVCLPGPIRTRVAHYPIAFAVACRQAVIVVCWPTTMVALFNASASACGPSARS